MTELRWIVEVTELEKAFNEAQENGVIPYYEGFDPAFLETESRFEVSLNRLLQQTLPQPDSCAGPRSRPTVQSQLFRITASYANRLNSNANG